MSEYQYYEFQAIDRPLSREEIQILRGYSTRARVTSTGFINEYSYGSFKGDEDEWMAKYFDAFLYVANWGTRVLMLRLPANLVSESTARAYCRKGGGNYEDALALRARDGNVILRFCSIDEEGGGEWIEGDGLLGSLVPIRSELAHRDLRALYLAWLRGIQDGDREESDAEPPVPPGLQTLWDQVEALVAAKQGKAYAEAVQILQDLREVAALRGTRSEFARQLANLRDRHAKKRTFRDRVGVAQPNAPSSLSFRLDLRRLSTSHQRHVERKPFTASTDPRPPSPRDAGCAPVAAGTPLSHGRARSSLSIGKEPCPQTQPPPPHTSGSMPRE